MIWKFLSVEWKPCSRYTLGSRGTAGHPQPGPALEAVSHLGEEKGRRGKQGEPRGDQLGSLLKCRPLIPPHPPEEAGMGSGGYTVMTTLPVGVLMWWPRPRCEKLAQG